MCYLYVINKTMAELELKKTISFHRDSALNVLSFLQKNVVELKDITFKTAANLTFVLQNEPTACVLIDMFDLPYSTTGVNKFAFKNDVIDALRHINGDIVVSFVTVINCYGSTDIFCWLKCDQNDRKKILSTTDDELKIHLWNNSNCNPHWMTKRAQFTKTFDTLYIDTKKMSKIKSILKCFNENKEHYLKMGIPYKLTFLLEGPPGTGKTSFIKVLSRELKRDIYVFNLDGIERIDDMLLKMDEIAAYDSNFIDGKSAADRIIAFEDIHKLDKSMFSQIFNVLDGIYDTTNCIIVLTSNVPYKNLDRTLMRCGRINYVVQFGYLTDETKLKMFTEMLPQFELVAADFVEKIKDVNITPAMMETYLLQHSFELTPYKLMQNVKTLIDTANEDTYLEYNTDGAGPNIMFV